MHCFSFCRHPAMSKWPVANKWFFMKLELIQVWLQDWVGGTSVIPLEDYFKATPFWEYQSLCITSAYKNRSVQLSAPHATLTRDENSQSSSVQRMFSAFFCWCCFCLTCESELSSHLLFVLLIISAFHMRYSVSCVWYWMYLTVKLNRVKFTDITAYKILPFNIFINTHYYLMGLHWTMFVV